MTLAKNSLVQFEERMHRIVEQAIHEEEPNAEFMPVVDCAGDLQRLPGNPKHDPYMEVADVAR